MSLNYWTITTCKTLEGGARLAAEQIGLEVYNAEPTPCGLGTLLYCVTDSLESVESAIRAGGELTDLATMERLSRTPADKTTRSIREAKEQYNDIPGGRWLVALVSETETLDEVA